MAHADAPPTDQADTRLDLWRPIVALCGFVAFGVLPVAAAVFLLGVAVYLFQHDGGAR